MDALEDLKDTDLPAVLQRIKELEASDVEKLAHAFDWITSRFIENTQPEIELARAMNDQEALVKAQVKVSMMNSARGIFQDCYRFMMGRRAWDE